MSERERERLYWKISVLFLLASPLVIYQLTRAHYSFEFHPITFTLILLVCMPALLLLNIALEKLFSPGTPLRFWVVKPSDEAHHLLSMPDDGGEASFRGLLEKTYLNQITETITARLGESKFSVAAEENADGSRLIRFRKEQDAPVLSFMEHAFFGEAHLALVERAVKVRVRVTFDDTLIVETGEFEQLRGLSHYLALKTPKLIYENVPVPLYFGLDMAFATVIVGLIPYLYQLGGHLFYTCLAAGAAGMILASLLMMQKNREHLFGYRLAFAGLCLTLLPFGALLLESFRQ